METTLLQTYVATVMTGWECATYHCTMVPLNLGISAYCIGLNLLGEVGCWANAYKLLLQHFVSEVLAGVPERYEGHERVVRMF
jgi:hypothetical protein